jgi:small-conductance mechanosensitive channel/CRP-like cAMP-binding protein
LHSHMNLSLLFCLAIVVDAVVLRLIPKRKQVIRFVCMSIFFAVETVLIVALVKSPLHPVYRVRDASQTFWIQILVSYWWVIAARELISFLPIRTTLNRAAVENRLLSDIIAASIYICSGLVMLGFVFEFPLQGVMATSGVIAIVLGLALQSSLSDVFSGISLNIEKPFRVGDEILLESGAEGEVVEINWRSAHLRNVANDLVIVPHSVIAKMRIQNHSGGSRRYNGSLTIEVDSRNEPQLVLETLKQAAMTCASILQQPMPSVAAVSFKADRITYEISFSTASIAAAGDARSQLITQLYKRAGPTAGRQGSTGLPITKYSLESGPISLFTENELFDHALLLQSLSEAEKLQLSAKIVRRHFKPGEQLLTQGATPNAVQFVFSGVVEERRKMQDGRELKFKRLGPGDSFGGLSLLTGHTEDVTLTSLTPGLLLGLHSDDLKPILESRPELVELVSHSVSQLQQYLAMFDQAATQAVAITQPDLLSRIKNFFRLTRGAA